MARRIGFGVVAAVAGVLLLEGTARLAGELVRRSSMPAEVRAYVEANRVVYDQDLGWRPAVVSGEVDTRWLGLGEVGLPLSPPPGRVRVFAFGDSQTQGGGVTPEEAWPAAAERALRAEGLDVEVINAGAPGYRSAQVLTLIETRVLAWAPDILVVDCMRRDSPASAQRDHGGVLAALLFESRLYRLLWLGVARARGQNIGLLDTSRPHQPLTPDTEEGEGNHAAILGAAAAAGVEVVFVDYPSRPTDRRVIEPGIRPEDLPAGAVLVPATQALLQSGMSPDELYFDVNHLRPAGNEIFGAEVARVLAPIVRRRGAATLADTDREARVGQPTAR